MNLATVRWTLFRSLPFDIDEIRPQHVATGCHVLLLPTGAVKKEATERRGSRLMRPR